MCEKGPNHFWSFQGIWHERTSLTVKKSSFEKEIQMWILCQSHYIFLVNVVMHTYFFLEVSSLTNPFPKTKAPSPRIFMKRKWIYFDINKWPKLVHQQEIKIKPKSIPPSFQKKFCGHWHDHSLGSQNQDKVWASQRNYWFYLSDLFRSSMLGLWMTFKSILWVEWPARQRTK